MHYVVRNSTTYVLENLPHFTTYTIQVQACRPHEENDVHKVCSAASLSTARTLKAGMFVNINAFIFRGKL